MGCKPPIGRLLPIARLGKSIVLKIYRTRGKLEGYGNPRSGTFCAARPLTPPQVGIMGTSFFFQTVEGLSEGLVL